MHALLSTLGVFTMILVLSRLKVPLWVAITAGAAAIGLLFGIDPAQTGLMIATGAIQFRAVGLALIMAALLGLSGLMQKSGLLDEIVSLTGTLLRRPAITMAALPALIGLLPMPGGALFSAPMVESAAGKDKVNPSLLSAINYWFRHIWEHWWPLYPGVMLAVTLTGLDYGTFLVFQLPLGLSMTAAGLVLFAGTHPDLHVKGASPPVGTKRRLFVATLPIWVILIVWVPAKFIYAATLISRLPEDIQGDVDKYAPLLTGLIASLIWTMCYRTISLRRAAKILFSISTLKMMALVTSVMVFQYALGRAEAAGKIAAELIHFHVPVVLVVAILPFIAGAITGLAVGFVGTSFPIVLGLVWAMGGDIAISPYVALAYGFGHIGQMVSPLHLCQVVSNEYFKTDFPPVYRKIWLPLLITAVLCVGYFVLLSVIM